MARAMIKAPYSVLSSTIAAARASPAGTVDRRAALRTSRFRSMCSRNCAWTSPPLRAASPARAATAQPSARPLRCESLR